MLDLEKKEIHILQRSSPQGMALYKHGNGEVKITSASTYVF